LGATARGSGHCRVASASCARASALPPCTWKEGILVTPEKPRGWHFSSKEAKFQLRSSSRMRDILRCSHAKAGSTPVSGTMKAAVLQILLGRRCSTVGHLNMDQANNRQTTLAVLARHPLHVYKQSQFDSDLRPQLFRHTRVASITVMHWSLKPVIRVRSPGDPPRTEQPIGRDRDLRIRRAGARGVGALQLARCGSTW
jgi:hypothetical protein